MKEVLIIDIETTGFNHRKNSIVELALVSLDLDTGDTEVVFNRIMREEKTTFQEVNNSWIIKNSTLTAEEVMVAHTFDFYKNEIQDIIDRFQLGCTAFNRDFDMRFVEFRGIRMGIKLRCPMRLSKDVLRIPSGRGYKMTNVTEAYIYFTKDYDYIEKHRAASDAMDEAVIVYELYRLGVF